MGKTEKRCHVYRMLLYYKFLTFIVIFSEFPANSLIHSDKDIGNSPCPKGCECTFWKSCRWSHIALPFISINVLPLRYRKRNEHIAAFAKNICNHKDLSVCCCGLEQTSPDYLRPKNLSASKNQDKKTYLEKNIFTGRVNDKMSRKSTFTGRSNDKMIRFRSEEFPTTPRLNKPLKHKYLVRNSILIKLNFYK